MSWHLGCELGSAGIEPSTGKNTFSFYLYVLDFGINYRGDSTNNNVSYVCLVVDYGSVS